MPRVPHMDLKAARPHAPLRRKGDTLMDLLVYIAVGVILAYLIIKHLRWILAGSVLVGMLCWGLLYSHPHPDHPYWVQDRNVPQINYVYRGENGHMEYLGWVFQDIGASNEWVAVYYAGTGIGVRTDYHATRREAIAAIENWYGKGGG